MANTIAYYGAVGDGVTDDTVAFQNALNGSSEVIINTPPVAYKITQTLVISHPIKIVGEGVKPYIVSTADLFDIRSSDVIIENLKLDTDSNRIFNFNTNISSLERITIKDILSFNSGHAYFDANHATNILVSLTVKNCQHRLHKGLGIQLQDAFAFIKFEDVTFDYVSAGYAGTTIYMINNQGSLFRDINILAAQGYGFYLDNNQAVQLINCHADTCQGRGFDLRGNEYVKVIGCTASLCYDHAFFLMNNNNIQVDTLFLEGRKHVGGAAGVTGFYGYTGNSNAIFNNIMCTQFTGYGYYVSAITGFKQGFVHSYNNNYGNI